MPRGQSEYQTFKRQMRDMIDDNVNNGMGRVAAIRLMFEHGKKQSDYDIEGIFPGFRKAVEKSNFLSIAALTKLIGFPRKDVMYAFSSLLLMGQVSDKFNSRVWIVMRRAAKYMPDYYDKHSAQLFYPFTALMLEAYLRTRSPQAWDVQGCCFGLRDQAWFEEHSNAYRNIINEFGAAALPECFV